jgi:hypothetical protein
MELVGNARGGVWRLLADFVEKVSGLGLSGVIPSS